VSESTETPTAVQADTAMQDAGKQDAGKQDNDKLAAQK
jgi:hypothetical protein